MANNISQSLEEIISGVQTAEDHIHHLMREKLKAQEQATRDRAAISVCLEKKKELQDELKSLRLVAVAEEASCFSQRVAHSALHKNISEMFHHNQRDAKESASKEATCDHLVEALVSEVTGFYEKVRLTNPSVTAKAESQLSKFEQYQIKEASLQCEIQVLEDQNFDCKSEDKWKVELRKEVGNMRRGLKNRERDLLAEINIKKNKRDVLLDPNNQVICKKKIELEEAEEESAMLHEIVESMRKAYEEAKRELRSLVGDDFSNVRPCDTTSTQINVEDDLGEEAVKSRKPYKIPKLSSDISRPSHQSERGQGRFDSQNAFENWQRKRIECQAQNHRSPTLQKRHASSPSSFYRHKAEDRGDGYYKVNHPLYLQPDYHKGYSTSDKWSIDARFQGAKGITHKAQYGGSSNRGSAKPTPSISQTHNRNTPPPPEAIEVVDSDLPLQRLGGFLPTPHKSSSDEEDIQSQCKNYATPGPSSNRESQHPMLSTPRTFTRNPPPPTPKEGKDHPLPMHRLGGFLPVRDRSDEDDVDCGVHCEPSTSGIGKVQMHTIQKTSDTSKPFGTTSQFKAPHALPSKEISSGKFSGSSEGHKWVPNDPISGKSSVGMKMSGTLDNSKTVKYSSKGPEMVSHHIRYKRTLVVHETEHGGAMTMKIPKS